MRLAMLQPEADSNELSTPRSETGVASAPVTLSKGGVFRLSMQEQEQWKFVIGYEGLYEVSNIGRVRSTGAVPGRWGPMPAIIMSQSLTGKGYKVGRGYLAVKLTKDKVGKLVKVHRLVAEAFIPNPDNLPQVDHGKEGKQCNAVRNLEWVTNQENQIRSVRDGHHRTVRGESQPTHKLTADQVISLKLKYLELKSSRNVAVLFGISKTQALRILNKESWNHL